MSLKKVIETARAEIGVHEEPAGSNRTVSAPAMSADISAGAEETEEDDGTRN